MKIGVIVPVGDLCKFGYHYNSNAVCENLKLFADKVIIISTSKTEQSKYFSKNINIISDNRTWFKTKNNEENFSFEIFHKNINLASDILKGENFDVAIQIHINQYIPQTSFDKIRQTCAQMIKEKQHYAWFYKKTQLQDMIFVADRKLPWILNLKTDNPFKFDSDSLINKNTGEKIIMQSGNFTDFTNLSVIDVFGEFTIKEAEDKHNFIIKEYRKLNNTFNSNNLDNLVFDKDQWFKYYLTKINHKFLSKEYLDQTGRQIIENTRPDFVSHFFKKKYKPIRKNIILKIINKIKILRKC